MVGADPRVCPLCCNHGSSVVRADDLPQLLRREWGFAPLCGAAATPVAALKTPVASEGG